MGANKDSVCRLNSLSFPQNLHSLLPISMNDKPTLQSPKTETWSQLWLGSPLTSGSPSPVESTYFASSLPQSQSVRTCQYSVGLVTHHLPCGLRQWWHSQSTWFCRQVGLGSPKKEILSQLSWHTRSCFRPFWDPSLATELAHAEEQDSIVNDFKRTNGYRNKAAIARPEK